MEIFYTFVLILYIAHCAKELLIVKKIQPNLIPSKTIPIGCVDLNSQMKFAICHWTCEICYIWHLQRKSGCSLVTQCNCLNLPRSSTNFVIKTMILLNTARILSPDFFKKCRIQPISQVQ